VVAAVVTPENQDELRRALTAIEDAAGTGRRKWHKSRSERRLRYLALALERNVAAGCVFFGVYRKPLPSFFPVIEVLERAIKAKARGPYAARVFVDGIDRQKAHELRIGRLDLIKRIAPAILVPDAVIEEIRAGQAKDRTAGATLKRADQYRIENVVVSASIERWDLGFGESQVIAHALNAPRWAVIVRLGVVLPVTKSR
jgi:hypothetical protein